MSVNYFAFVVVLYLFSTVVPAAISPIEGKSGASPQDFHICYFSLNNEKEFQEMERFTKKINAHSDSTNCRVHVTEYMTQGKTPEHAFEQMVKSNKKCNGLVISGKHTDVFSGSRTKGSLSEKFLAKLSCKPQYAKWFSQINALWLQGNKTVEKTPALERTLLTSPADVDSTALFEESDFPEGDHIEFPATLDSPDNPLSSDYLKGFPKATVFGWTHAAPGKKAKSEFSIPYHMAHISKMMNNQDKFPSESPIKGTWTKDSAVKYLTSMIGVLNGGVNTDCKQQVAKAWKNHGQVTGQLTEYGFANPNLNAYTPLKGKRERLQTARLNDCQLKKSYVRAGIGTRFR